MGTFKDAFNTMLGTATPGYTLTLTRGGSQSGAVYYSAPVYAHTGFSAYVYWKASSCDTVNNGADGFTLFLSKSLPQSSDVYMSSGGSLGIGAVPNVTMIAYSATFNEFYVCKWTTPLDTSFRWVCDFVFQSPIPKMTCSTSTGFNYSYDGVTFKLQYRSVTFNTTLKLDPVPYYVGLSGSTGGGYFTQEIKAWSFDSTAV